MPALSAKSVTKSPLSTNPSSQSSILGKNPWTIEKVQAKQPYLKVLLYGGPGTGKTLTLGNLGDLDVFKRVAIINTDYGDLSIAQKDVDIVTVKDIPACVNFIKQLDVNPDLAEYNTIAVDSLDALYNLQLAEQIRSLSIGRRQDTPDIPAQQDYLVGHSRIRTMLELLRKIPKHVFCIVHSHSYVDASSLTYQVPDMPGKLTEEVSRYFDVVGYLYTQVLGKKVSYRAQFHPFSRVIAKERSQWSEPKLGPVVDFTDANLGDIIYRACIEGIAAKDYQASLSKVDQVSGDAALVDQIK